MSSTVLNVRIFGYARRSTDEQPTASDVQVEALTRWAAAGEHELLEVAVETVSGGSEPEDRPVLSGLLDRLAAHEVDALAVTTTDRLARSNAVHRLDYYGDREGWAVVILDAPDRRLDPESRLLHGIRVNVSEYERALISRRTKSALAYKKAAGVRLGRPRRCPDLVLEHVALLRAAKRTLAEITFDLNDIGILTPGGGKQWWPSHVSRLLATQDGQAALAAAVETENERVRSRKGDGRRAAKGRGPGDMTRVSGPPGLPRTRLEPFSGKQKRGGAR
jgi:DNA invertase Pin-like site-specific DNA recombinase